MALAERQNQAEISPPYIARYSTSRRAFGAVWSIVGGAVTIFWGACSSVLIWPWVVLPRGTRERYAMIGAQWFAWMVIRTVLFTRVTVVGREHVPDGGYLVVSNHRSWLDVPLLQLYTRSQGISKKEVAYIPFFGLNGHLTGAIFFDRKDPMGRARVIQDALRVLAGRGALHVFPEGTRTRTGDLAQKVHLRLLQAASDAGYTLLPACTWGTETSIPAEGIYAMPFQSVGIEIGAPVARRPGQTAEQHAQAAWDRVIALADKHRANEPF